MSAYRKPQKPSGGKTTTPGVVVRLAEPPDDPEEAARGLEREQAKLWLEHQKEAEREARGFRRLTKFLSLLARSLMRRY